MKLKTEISYIIIYWILTLLAIMLATNFWWTDSLNLSFLKRESFLILCSVGICWIGIIYLSIYIIRKFIVKIDSKKFFGPIDLISNEVILKEIGKENAVKFKNTMAIIAFPILIFTLFVYFFSIRLYEKNQLKTYGKIENVSVKEIRYDIKKNQFIYFKYNQGKDSTNLANDKNLQIGNNVEIIYSKKNPKIIGFYD